jgi:2-desacetyl-2-hydroxyethyl bacteriochlorophyllide A dehydrogenase
MKRRAVVIESPFRVRLSREEIPPPAGGEVVVRVAFSAISAGTEMLAYRGRLPADLPLDDCLPALAGPVRYPLRYGYAAVGAVEAVGAEVATAWRGRRVFCFHPHADRACVRAQDLVPVPEELADHDALFLASMETAVTLMLDGRPGIGERAVVFGQGVVGLLATALLARHPLQALYAVDPVQGRRQASLAAGAHACFAPERMAELKSRLSEDASGPLADLVFELTGDPRSLDPAIDTAGFGARVVIGSWYGDNTAELHLGGRFHRSRIRLIASQVSTLPAELTARWDRSRRLATAWEMIHRIRPAQFITHEVPAERVAQAYELLDRRPEEALQVVLTYG